jgi:hypothetical protein
MITTRPWLDISPPDWFINSDTPQLQPDQQRQQVMLVRAGSYHAPT